MYDPYDSATPNDPKAPATDLFVITPSDTVALAKATKGLRIYATAAGKVTAKLVGGTAPVTFSVPAGLTVERIRVAQVMTTGTTAGLEILGYGDGAEVEAGSE